MFGDLFEGDDSSVSNNQYGKEKKLKTNALEPPAPREFTNLSGIRNQGGTCYLNSLLQTLHFTPEFREALFSLGSEELGIYYKAICTLFHVCIPYLHNWTIIRRILF
uniref:ubiquitinyl hydrolase 1 n=1 Tax=Urocitellus parryii TaxID=9999 RepID=A0A8D2ICN0_UROPR